MGEWQIIDDLVEVGPEIIEITLFLYLKVLK